jgi:hypothetical protein
VKANAQSNQIAGLVSGEDERLGSASIKNISGSAQSFSNEKGEFKIVAKKGDTLITSKVNYTNDTSLVGDEQSVFIHLKKTAVLLKEVTINSTAITPESVYEANKKDYKDIYWKGDKSHIFFANMDPYSGAGVGVNIDKIYNALSKEGRDARQLQRNLVKDYKNSVVDRRFNQLAARVTGYTGKRLEDFITDNRPNYDTMIKSSDYDLIQYIKRKMPKIKRK